MPLKSIQYFELKRGVVSGCCAGSYFYDLGSAHHKPRAKTVNDFAFKVIELGYQQLNTAMTNGAQTKEREYLEAIGFKQASKKGGLYIHTATSEDMDKALTPFLKLYEEAVKKEQLEEKKRREEIARIALEEMKKRREGKQVKVTANDIRQVLYSKPDDIFVGPYLKEVYGFKQPLTNYGATCRNIGQLWNQDVAGLAKSVNHRLLKEGKITL